MPTPSDSWRDGLPELHGDRITLRELRPSDAESLFTELASPEVKRFMWAPPPDVDAFRRFIEWTHAERATGKYICYGIVPAGEEGAVGVFELRQLQPGFFRGELGFVMPPRLWGRGIFLEGATLVLDFGFSVVRIHRVEARSAVDNDRGNAALEHIGALREGRLKQAFLRDGVYVDQYLWGIVDTDWRRRQGQPSERSRGSHPEPDEPDV
jgi:RimJ/RimL family protein N-acetyltransferase